VRILNNADVERVLTLDACMSALRDAYRELSAGKAENRPRNHSYLPVAREGFTDCQYRFKSQEGGGGSSDVWALRLTSEMIGSELVEGVKRRRYIAAAPGGKYCGLVLLFSTSQLEPLALLHDSYIQKMRCSATSALAMDALANPGVRVAALFGAGWQARSHLQYMLHVRPSLSEVRVFSPVAAERNSFAAEWAASSGRKIVAVDSPRDAVAGAQLVVCATNTFNPCFDGTWIEPGAHVSSITHPDQSVVRRELDDTILDRADRIAVLSREQIHHDRQVDLLGTVERGRKSLTDLIELSDLLAGKATGRTSPEQITVFANNTGMGLQFAAVGARVLALAEQQKLGREIPAEWLLQDTPP